MRRIKQALLSRMGATLAMAAAAGLLLAGQLLPQDGEAIDALRAKRPQLAWVAENVRPEAFVGRTFFLVLSGYVGLATVACMVHRIWSRSLARRREEMPLERFVARRSVVLPGSAEVVARRVEHAVSGSGFPGARRARAGEIGGRRSEFGFWGSILFHLGLLATLGATVVSAVGRFDGELVLVEGEPVEVRPGAMVRAIPEAGLAPLHGTRLTATSVSAEYTTSDQPVNYTAVLEAVQPGEAPVKKLVGVNEPVELGGYQLSLHRYGFAPEVSVVDASGRVRADGLAVVRVLPPGTEDSVALEGGGELQLRFYPDFRLKDGEPLSRTRQPLKPVIAFRWIEGGVEVASGRVGRGEEVWVNGARVAFPSLHYWVDLLVKADPGLPWFAVGMFLCCLGLALRFAWHEVAWKAKLTPGEGGVLVDLAMSARYFPASLAVRADRVAQMLR